jgi:hypothetical protein
MKNLFVVLSMATLFSCNNSKPSETITEKTAAPVVEQPEELKAIVSNLTLTQNSKNLENLLKELGDVMDRKRVELKREPTEDEKNEVRQSINFEERFQRIGIVNDSLKALH